MFGSKIRLVGIWAMDELVVEKSRWRFVMACVEHGEMEIIIPVQHLVAHVVHVFGGSEKGRINFWTWNEYQGSIGASTISAFPNRNVFGVRYWVGPTISVTVRIAMSKPHVNSMVHDVSKLGLPIAVNVGSSHCIWLTNGDGVGEYELLDFCEIV